VTTATRRPALKATGLRKSFGDKVVLDGIDLDIAEGTTFSLLGPNGAGITALGYLGARALYNRNPSR
jgi:ABC-2 type transport system ATP-binding protein